MISSRCQKCGLTQAQTEVCKRCGTAIVAGVTQPRYSQPVSTEHARYQGDGRNLKTGMAVASLILSLIAIPTGLFLIGLIFVPIALILGIMAFRRAQRQPHIYGGQGMAIAGIVISIFVCVIIVPIILAIAIPNIFAAKRAANEGSALRLMEKIVMAQQTYTSTIDTTTCGDLKALAAKDLIEPHVATGTVNGFLFVAGGIPNHENGCEVRATPLTSSDGNRSFYFSTADNTVRYALKGVSATRKDQPLEGPKRQL